MKHARLTEDATVLEHHLTDEHIGNHEKSEAIKSARDQYLSTVRQLIPECQRKISAIEDAAEQRRILSDYLTNMITLNMEQVRGLIPVGDLVRQNSKEIVEIESIAAEMVDSLMAVFGSVDKNTDGTIDFAGAEKYVFEAIELAERQSAEFSRDNPAVQLIKSLQDWNQFAVTQTFTEATKDPTNLEQRKISRSEVVGRKVLFETTATGLMLLAAVASCRAIGSVFANLHMSAFPNGSPLDNEAFTIAAGEINFPLIDFPVLEALQIPETSVSFITALSYGVAGLGSSMVLLNSKIKIRRLIEDRGLKKGLKTFARRHTKLAIGAGAILVASLSADHLGAILQGAQADANDRQADAVIENVQTGYLGPMLTNPATGQMVIDQNTGEPMRQIATLKDLENPTNYAHMMESFREQVETIPGTINQFLDAEKGRGNAAGSGPAYRAKSALLQAGKGNSTSATYAETLTEASVAGLDLEKGMYLQVQAELAELEEMLKEAEEKVSETFPEIAKLAERGSRGVWSMFYESAATPAQMKELQDFIAGEFSEHNDRISAKVKRINDIVENYEKYATQIDSTANTEYGDKSGLDFSLDFKSPDMSALADNILQEVPPVNFLNALKLKGEFYDNLEATIDDPTETPEARTAAKERRDSVRKFSFFYPVTAELGDIIFLTLVSGAAAIIGRLRNILRGMRGQPPIDPNARKKERANREKTLLDKRIDEIIDLLEKMFDSDEWVTAFPERPKPSRNEIRYVLQKVMKSRSALLRLPSEKGLKDKAIRDTWSYFTADSRPESGRERHSTKKALNRMRNRLGFTLKPPFIEWPEGGVRPTLRPPFIKAANPSALSKRSIKALMSEFTGTDDRSFTDRAESIFKQQASHVRDMDSISKEVDVKDSKDNQDEIRVELGQATISWEAQKRIFSQNRQTLNNLSADLETHISGHTSLKSAHGDRLSRLKSRVADYSTAYRGKIDTIGTRFEKMAGSHISGRALADLKAAAPALMAEIKGSVFTDLESDLKDFKDELGI